MTRRHSHLLQVREARHDLLEHVDVGLGGHDGGLAVGGLLVLPILDHQLRGREVAAAQAAVPPELAPVVAHELPEGDLGAVEGVGEVRQGADVAREDRVQRNLAQAPQLLVVHVERHLGQHVGGPDVRERPPHQPEAQHVVHAQERAHDVQDLRGYVLHCWLNT